MLNQFRNMAGSFASKLLLILLVLSFAVWGIGDIVQNPPGNKAVATVGSESIPFSTYQRMLHRETEKLRQAFGDKYSPELFKGLNIEQQVLRSLINEQLMEQEARSLGLVPGNDDTARLIKENPGFKDSLGNFDRARFQAVLKNSSQSEKSYIEQSRREIGANLLVATLADVQPLLPIAAETLYETREEQRSVTLYALQPSLMSSLPDPDDKTLAEYYKNHEKDFSAPESRTVSYVVLKNDAVLKKVSVPENDLKQAYQERVEEFRLPEQRALEQLLYSSEASADKAHKMLQSGKKFSDVAASTDILNKNSVSMGKVERGNIIESAADAVFALKENEYTNPIKSPFGWHIFRVKLIDPARVAGFDEVRETLEKDLAQNQVEDALHKLANTLEDTLAAGSTLQETAKELGLNLLKAGPFTKDGKSPTGQEIKPLPDLEKFVDTAFKTEEKTESSLISSKGGVSYLLRVDDVTPERVLPLDDVRGAVTDAWKKEQRQEQLGKLASDIAGKFADEATRTKIIIQHDLQAAYTGSIKRSSKTAGDISLPPELVAETFSRKPGESTKSHLLKSGSYAIAVVGDVIAVKLDKSETAKKRLSEIQAELQGNIQNELTEQYMNYLAGKYPVWVNTPLLTAKEE